MGTPPPPDHSPPVQHRLAVVFCADVVGYSRLMGIDEEGTLGALAATRAELFDPAIVAHRGRIVRTTGDGLLVEFHSVVDAVRCALAVQESMPSREVHKPLDRRLHWRIGINMGDVVTDGDVIYGDGVAIASRLEGLAEPDGINVSRAVRDQVRDRLPLTLEDLGEHAVTGVARPVRAFRVLIERAEDVAHAAPAAPKKRAVPLIRAAIAVLPFQTPAANAEVEFFRDSIGEDLITELARARWFSVIARNSSFVYKDRTADARQVASELGVRYLLEGSIRTAGNRMRIACQLTDASSGRHLWANRFEGSLDDSFDLQDKITESVAGAVDPILRGTEIERAQQASASAANPYDLWLRAIPLAFSASLADTDGALELLSDAAEAAPDFAAAPALSAWCLQQRYLLMPSGMPDNERQQAKRLARAAIRLGRDDPPSLALAAAVLASVTRDWHAALAAVDQGMLINPKSAFVLSFDALTRCLCGAYDQAIEHGEKALHLSPFDPLVYHASLALAWACLLTGRYEDAAVHARRAVEGNPAFVFPYCVLAAAAARTGARAEAVEAIGAALRAAPGFGIRALRRIRFADAALIQGDLKRLQAVGLPE
jgi:adenylate cyclase